MGLSQVTYAPQHLFVEPADLGTCLTARAYPSLLAGFLAWPHHAATYVFFGGANKYHKGVSLLTGGLAALSYQHRWGMAPLLAAAQCPAHLRLAPVGGERGAMAATRMRYTLKANPPPPPKVPKWGLTHGGGGGKPSLALGPGVSEQASDSGSGDSGYKPTGSNLPRYSPMLHASSPRKDSASPPAVAASASAHTPANKAATTGPWSSLRVSPKDDVPKGKASA